MARDVNAGQPPADTMARIQELTPEQAQWVLRYLSAWVPGVLTRVRQDGQQPGGDQP